MSQFQFGDSSPSPSSSDLDDDNLPYPAELPRSAFLDPDFHAPTYLSTLGICSVWGAVASIGFSLIGERYNGNWFTARSFYFACSRLLGIDFDVEGEEYLNTRPAVLVGNHQSMVDILYLGRCAAHSSPQPACRADATPLIQNLPQAGIDHGKEGVTVHASAWSVHDPRWCCLHRSRK